MPNSPGSIKWTFSDVPETEREILQCFDRIVFGSKSQTARLVTKPADQTPESGCEHDYETTIIPDTIADHGGKHGYLFHVKIEDLDGLALAQDVGVFLIQLENVAELPGKPDPPAVTPVPDEFLEISWTAPETPDELPILGYHLEVNGTGAPEDAFDVSETEETVDGLMTDTLYSVRVRAYNGDGDGPWSDPTTAIILESESSGELMVTPLPYRTLGIDWTLPETLDGVSIEGYSLEIVGPGAPTNSIELDVTNYRAENLRADKEYVVRVSVHDSEGGIPWSPATTARTLPNVLPVFPEDQGSGIVRMTSETFADEVDTGRMVGAPVLAVDADGGTITYSLDGADKGLFSIDSSTGRISTKPDNLYDYETQSSYTLTVRAADHHPNEPKGSAEAQVTVEITNQLEAPLQMDPPTLSMIMHTSMQINWTHPYNSGRPTIDQYEIDFNEGLNVDREPDFEATPESTNHQIDGLLHDTLYNALVRARNSEGVGPWSLHVDDRTLHNKRPRFNPDTTERSPGRKLP